MRINSLISGFVILSLFSCDKGDTGTGHSGNVNLCLQDVPSEGKALVAFFDRNGVLKGAEEVVSGSDGRYGVSTDITEGSVYVIGGEVDYPYIASGDKLSTFKDAIVSVEEGCMPGLFYTASKDFDNLSSGTMSLNARYAVARLGMRVSLSKNSSVSGFTIHNSAVEGYVFPSEHVRSPQSCRLSDIRVDYQDGFNGDTNQVALLFEQDNPQLAITVDVVVDGREFVLEHTLPAVIERSKTYYVNLMFADEPSISVTVEEWNDGEDTGLYPDFGSVLTVDTENSMIPDNVYVTDGGKTIELPHLQTDFTFSVDCNSSLELLPATDAPVSVESLGSNMYRVTKPLTAPGVPGSRVLLKFRRQGLDNVYPEDTLSLVLHANPVISSGLLDFDNPAYTHDFDRYIDNQIEVFTLPEGKSISLEFPHGEDSWATLFSEGSISRLVAGWRPNDTTANGRKQSVNIVISNEDGTDREVYTVTRLNYGLPVTFLHGVWWCKYNARGNSSLFDDQILSSDDPAVKSGVTLYEYLQNCSADEFYNLWGWAYQGDSGQALQVVDQDGKLVLDGFSSTSSVHMNKLEPTFLAPEGYEVPSMDDFNRIFDATGYIWVMWDGKHQVKVPWEGHSYISRRQKRRNDLIIGTVSASDIIVVSMYSDDYPQYEPLVWYGPGSQWDANGIMHNGHYNNMLFTVYSPEGSGWFVSGGMSNLYLMKNGAGTRDTRILRFKKSDVEYIY